MTGPMSDSEVNEARSREDYAHRLHEHHGHVPVLRDRVTDLLSPAVERAGDGAVIVDGTLGAGGHAEHFLRTFPRAVLIGFDRDPQALANATARIREAGLGERFCGVHARYDEVERALERERGRSWSGRGRTASPGLSTTSASPPCSSIRRSAALPTGRTPPWICG